MNLTTLKISESQTNILMNDNLILFNLRKEGNLSRREAAKKCHLPLHSLKNMEEGYWKIKGKRKEKILAGYELESDPFGQDGNLGYIAKIDEETPKEKKLLAKLAKIGRSWPFFGSCLAI